MLAVGILLGSQSVTYKGDHHRRSGALYGLLVAFALYYPDRPLLILSVPIPAKYFVMIVGAMAFLSTPNQGVSETAHLGGLAIGYLYLRAAAAGLTAN